MSAPEAPTGTGFTEIIKCCSAADTAADRVSFKLSIQRKGGVRKTEVWRTWVQVHIHPELAGDPGKDASDSLVASRSVLLELGQDSACPAPSSRQGV